MACAMVIAKSKKVKPQMNNTIKNMDYNWSPGSDPPNNQERELPRAMFIPHANSLPFEERNVTLEQPVKIGRNVYRSTPSPTNTIFECRVLSRHHATISYEKGHFYLVDNQSSNGTFINGNRCSSAKAPEPHEVFSGDVVQFGISVVENAGNSEKNTFPPVVALLKLYHPDGKEAKLAFDPTMTTPLHLKELYQLNNYVQEAMQREVSLENRLRTLRECVERARAEAQTSWEMFVGEQRLLLRVHALENMLAAGKHPELHHVKQLLADKENYQKVAIQNLRSAHEQRLALEETLERRSREIAALHHHNCTLKATANNAMQELQKLATRCERKICAARLAISAAEEREAALRAHLPLSYSIQNGEAKMLILSTDSNRISEEKRGTSLEEAVRSLPDYIKMLLPQHLLNMVGVKSLTAEGKSAKEFELILQRNNVFDDENKEKHENQESEKPESGGGEACLDVCTDDEKQSRLNHDGVEDKCSPIDGELRADKNANSEPDNIDDASNIDQLQLSNILVVMGGLNDEIKGLRSRLAATTSENEQLRHIRDKLLAAQPEPRVEPTAVAEDRNRQADLQAQLTRSLAAEEANLNEIQRLSSVAAELQAELSFRPTREDFDRLMTDLNTQVEAKQQRSSRPVVRDQATETDQPATPEDDIGHRNISLEIDEMFKLDDEDDDTDSAATEIDVIEKTEQTEQVNLLTAEFVKLDDEERLQVSLQNGSLHALEEELVRAKEGWERASAERAVLANRLSEIQSNHNVMPRALFVFLPVMAAILVWVIMSYIS